MGDYYVIFILVILVFAIFSFIKAYKKDKEEQEQLKRRVYEDEYLYNHDDKGRLTLEQAENGYSMIDPSENESGLPYIKVIELTREESINETYALLPKEITKKVNKKQVDGIIGLIEKLTYPDHILTEERLQKAYDILFEYNSGLEKEEIKIIWST